MIAVIALIVGVFVGAIGMAVLSHLATDAQRPAIGSAARHLLQRSHPEDTALSRYLDEHAGGSRHIRTNPSLRDRLE
jgi:hypothetical protein